jgi:hypothetical protein
VKITAYTYRRTKPVAVLHPENMHGNLAGTGTAECGPKKKAEDDRGPALIIPFLPVRRGLTEDSIAVADCRNM